MSTPDQPRRSLTAHALLILLTCLGAVRAGEGPSVPLGPALGTPVEAERLRSLSRTVFPNGEGLPEGAGDVAAGETLFAQRCAHCHGSAGTGATAPELAYAQMPLDSEYPDQTIGSYWPYATTVFDFIRRAMPMEAPGSLSDSEVYDLTAYLLHLNGLHERDAPLTRKGLIGLKMPNRDSFRWVDVPQPGHDAP